MSLLQLELEQQAVDHQQSPMHRSESLPSGIVAEHCGAIQMTRDATGRSEDGILAVEMNRSRTETDCKISEIYSKNLQMVTFQQYKLVGAFGWLTTPKLNVHYFSRVFFFFFPQNSLLGHFASLDQNLHLNWKSFLFTNV